MKWRSCSSGNWVEVEWCVDSLVEESDCFEWEPEELFVDKVGGKIKGMEWEHCRSLSLDSELSVDLFGWKIDDIEWGDCGRVSLDADPPDPELSAGKISGMEWAECDILIISSQIGLSMGLRHLRDTNNQTLSFKWLAQEYVSNRQGFSDQFLDITMVENIDGTRVRGTSVKGFVSHADGIV